MRFGAWALVRLQGAAVHARVHFWRDVYGRVRWLLDVYGRCGVPLLGAFARCLWPCALCRVGAGAAAVTGAMVLPTGPQVFFAIWGLRWHELFCNMFFLRLQEASDFLLQV